MRRLVADHSRPRGGASSRRHAAAKRSQPSGKGARSHPAGTQIAATSHRSKGKPRVIEQIRLSRRTPPRGNSTPADSLQDFAGSVAEVAAVAIDASAPLAYAAHVFTYARRIRRPFVAGTQRFLVWLHDDLHGSDHIYTAQRSFLQTVSAQQSGDRVYTAVAGRLIKATGGVDRRRTARQFVQGPVNYGGIDLL